MMNCLARWVPIVTLDEAQNVSLEDVQKALIKARSRMAACQDIVPINLFKDNSLGWQDNCAFRVVTMTRLRLDEERGAMH